MYKAEHLSCLIDAGRIKSIGRFVTQHHETIEIGICRFDGIISGFRWNEETGWEPIFFRRYDSTNHACVITIWRRTENNLYGEEEIALALEQFFAEQQTPGSA